MTSPYERPDKAALEALAGVAESLGAELASWRRRALEAEEALSAAVVAERAATSAPAIAPEEEAELRRRLARARDLVDLLRTRLRFLEERSEGAA